MNRYERIDFDELESLSFTGGAEGEGESRGLPSLIITLPSVVATIKNCQPVTVVVMTKEPWCIFADKK